MKNVYLAIGLFLVVNLQAQVNTDREPDPKAKTVLQDLAKHINSFDDLTYQFELTISYPESKTDDVIEGKYLQKGDLYRLETPTHYFICNAKDKWLVDVEGREIQIHDYVASTGEDISDPQSLLNIYANPNYDYRFVFEGMQGGKDVQVIEFKPITRGNDMTKAILTIDRENHQIHKMEVFNRDGSKLNLSIQSIETNTDPAEGSFTVTDAEFPNFNTEDLRIE